MEFLLLAVLGLATFGMKETMSPDEEEETSNGKKSDTKKETSNGKKNSDEDTKKKSKQKLIEAIAEYEAENRDGEKSKLLYEIIEK